MSTSLHQAVNLRNRHETQQDATTQGRSQAQTFSDEILFERPVMMLQQATSYINTYLASSPLDQTDKTTIELIVQDAESPLPLLYADDFTIEIGTTLKDFILNVQAEINLYTAPSKYRLVTQVDIVIDELIVGMPCIKGERVFKKHGDTGAQQIQWTIDRETEQFYAAFKVLLLHIGDCGDVKRPYFTVTTSKNFDDEEIQFEHAWHTFENRISTAKLETSLSEHVSGVCRSMGTDLQTRLESLALDSGIQGSMIRHILNKESNFQETHTSDAMLAAEDTKGFTLDPISFSDKHLPISVDDDDDDDDDDDIVHLPKYTSHEKAVAENTEAISRDYFVTLPYTDWFNLNDETILGSAFESHADEAAIGFDSEDDEVFFNSDPQNKQSSSKFKTLSTICEAHKLSRSRDSGFGMQQRPLVAGDRSRMGQNTATEQIHMFNTGLYGGSGIRTPSDTVYLNALATASTQSCSPFAYTMPTAATQQRSVAVAPYSSSVQCLAALPAITPSNQHSASVNGPLGLVSGSSRISSSDELHSKTFDDQTKATAVVTSIPCTNTETSMNGFQAFTQPSRFQGSSSRRLQPRNAPNSHYPSRTPTIAASTTPKPVLPSPIATILDQQCSTSLRVSKTVAGCNVRKFHADTALRAETPEFRSTGTNAGTSQTYHAPGMRPRSRAYGPARNIV